MVEVLKETLAETLCCFYAWTTMPYLIFLFIFIKNYLTKLYYKVII